MSETKVKVEGLPGGVLNGLDKMAGTSGRYQLDCMLVGGHQMVASDGAVLGQVTLDDDTEEFEQGKYALTDGLLKRKPCDILCDGESITAEQGYGKSGRRVVYDRRESGEYPDYEQVLPSEDQKVCSVEVDIDDFQNALEVVESTGTDAMVMVVEGDFMRMSNIGCELNRRGDHNNLDDFDATVVMNILRKE